MGWREIEGARESRSKSARKVKRRQRKRGRKRKCKREKFNSHLLKCLLTLSHQFIIKKYIHIQ